MPATALQEPTVTPELRRYVTAHRAIRLTQDVRPPAKAIECFGDDDYASFLQAAYSTASKPRKRVTSAEICNAVLHHFHGVSLPELKSKIRMPHLTEPRHVAVFIIMEYLPYSSTQAGIAMGLDSSSIRHAYRKMKRRIAVEPELAAQVREIVESCGLEPRP